MANYKLKIKFNNQDKFNFKQNKPLRITILILGIILSLLGFVGIIIDAFFSSKSYGYHQIAGNSNWPRFLLGIFLLLTFYIIKKSK